MVNVAKQEESRLRREEGKVDTWQFYTRDGKVGEKICQFYLLYEKQKKRKVLSMLLVNKKIVIIKLIQKYYSDSFYSTNNYVFISNFFFRI